MSVEPRQPYYAQVADALRAEIRDGSLGAGDKLPSESELRKRFNVSVNTVRAALVQLRAEGLIASRHGAGVYVAEGPALRRLSSDITTGVGFYSMTARMGERPTTKTEVRREPASEDVAEGLNVPVGTEVVVRHRIMGTEQHPLVSLATSYFPTFVVDAAPNLADPTISGLPKWLRDAFGETYSDDVIDARMPTAEERERLEIPEGTPVIILKGRTMDAQHRILHFISKVTVAGRLQYAYRFGHVPEEDVPS